MTVYARLMWNWERVLTLKDRNRQIFPFNWGLDWINGSSCRASRTPVELVQQAATEMLQDSASFYTPRETGSYSVHEDILSFETPTPGPHSENNRAHCRLFTARDSDAAVVVVPQWNARSESHVNLCKILRRLGITAVRLTLPYHESRAPEGMVRADFMVSPNIGRTLHATRQAVLETRLIVDWLRQQGYRRVGVVGTSIGSCVSFLAFVHDPQIEIGVFNLVSAHFADVVWRGLSTRYVRWGLEGHINLEELRKCWAPLSPCYFIPRLKQNRSRPHLLITARYDLTFLPDMTREVFETYRSHQIPCQRVDLPCGHYTTGRFPFSYLDGWHICRFLKKHLS